MQLQRAMNSVKRDLVLPRGEHSEFDLSWMKSPHYNRAKIREQTSQRGQGRGRGRGRRRTRVPEVNINDEKETNIILDENKSRETTKKSAERREGETVRRRGSDDSDWILPARRNVVPESEDGPSQRQLRPRTRTVAFLEELPDTDGEEELPDTGGEEGDDPVPRVTGESTAGLTDPVLGGVERLVDKEISNTSNDNKNSEKVKKKKRPREKWFTRNQIARM